MKTYFIQLTDTSNNLVLVNPNHIKYVGVLRSGTNIYFVSGDDITVKETPTQIQGKIQ